MINPNWEENIAYDRECDRSKETQGQKARQKWKEENYNTFLSHLDLL